MSAAIIHQAYLAMQKGDYLTARTLLRRVIMKEPHNELAWYLLAQVVDQREHAIECLRQVLKINPENDKAAHELAALKQDKTKLREPAPTTTPEPAAPAGQETIPPEKPLISDDWVPASVPASPSINFAPASRMEHSPDFSGTGEFARTGAEDRGYAKKDTPFEEDVDLSRHRRRSHVNWPLLLGLVIVILLFFIAIAGPQLAPTDPLEEHVIVKAGDEWVIPPFRAFSVPGFPLGSDQFGRDLLSRVLWAVRPTLTMVAVVSLVRLILGSIIGLGAGWFTGRIGRWLDTLISTALAVPVLLVALGAIAMLGSELGLIAFIIGLSINGWGETARIVREQTQVIKGQLYVEAARAMGSSSLQILKSHVLRQIMPMIWMLFAFEVSHTMMVTAGLGFLGYYIGGDVWIDVADFVSRRVSGMPELGQMLATSWTTLTEPWPMVLTGTVIFMIILGFNLMGEGLRLRLDPERASRNNPLARATRSASWWLEERVAYPLGAFMRKNALPIGIAGVLLLATGGGLYWWQTDGLDQRVPSQAALDNPGGNFWSAERGNPYGTVYSGAEGVQKPQILWQIESEAAYSGGPIVSAEGNLFIASNDNQLIALDPGGTELWRAGLPATPVGSPAIDASYNIYVVDVQGGLSKFNPEGSILWHIDVDEPGTPSHGPIAAPSDRIYYLIENLSNDYLVSVSSAGDLMWVKESGTRRAGSIPRLSPDGDMIFVKNKVIDAQDGRLLDIESPTAEDPVLSGREQFFSGADGRTYIKTGHIVMQWAAGSSGLEIVQAAEWNYQSAGVNRNTTAPVDAGVTQEQVVWIFYSWQYGDTRMVWTDAQGRILGVASPSLATHSIMAGVDAGQTYYICGIRTDRSQGAGPACMAYRQGSTEPLWELSLNGAQGDVTGAALGEGRIYVTTQVGMLFAVGEDESPTQAEAEQEATEVVINEQVDEAPLPDATETPGTGAIQEEGNVLESQIAWQYQVPEPFNTDFWYNFETTEDGWVYIHTQANNMYILNSQGALETQFALPAAPFVQSDGRYTIWPIPLPDKSLVFISQENTVFGLAQDGSIVWQQTLDAAPQAYPAIVRDHIYIVDKSANLYVFNSQGLVWRYKPQGETKGTNGAVIGADGTIFYTALVDSKAYVHALNPDGLLKWATAVRTGFFYDELQINGPGTLLFLKDDIFDAQQGILLDVAPPFDIDEYIMGDDGLTYMRKGHTVMQWELTEEGIQVVQTAQWNYEAVDDPFGGFSRGPGFTRVSSAQVIWMFYGDKYIWLALDGTVLGSVPSWGGTLGYVDFSNTRMIQCSQKPGEEFIECDDYRTGSDEPSQVFRFAGLANTAFGQMSPTEVYAVTEENIIYKVNVQIPEP